jgi:hypothetical protein
MTNLAAFQWIEHNHQTTHPADVVGFGMLAVMAVLLMISCACQRA